MASHGTLHPDTPIRTKVTFNGSTRRFKFNLRDLGANVLLGKLRALLLIPDGQQVTFERYSDSSGGYILLDPKDPTAFKQLFRAARAKLKLRIQATLVPVDAPQVDASPTETGANHEHVLPSEASSSFPVNPFLCLSPAYASKASLALEPPPFEELATVEEKKFPRASPEELDKAVASAVSAFLDGEEYLQKLRETVREEVEKLDRSVSEAPVPASFTAPLVESPQESSDVEVKANSRCSTYAIYCNACEMNIYDVHYHCGVCDRGDYDLCQACVDRGIHCNDSTHWLIKRMLSAAGAIVVSTTFIKKKVEQKDLEKEVSEPASSLRLTCNSCVAERPRKDFVTCKVCEDYDICVPCHIAVKHGHNPSHEFVPATPETILEPRAVSLLAPGRGRHHYASCDGCDQQINGVRHKCLNCPDWDYCSRCINTAPENHPGHRFVPIYDPLPLLCATGSSVKHDGIYCDGPLCSRTNRSRIVGARYKCAICPDLDFCASCEACPTNQHNPTHPLIKLKTPIRSVHITTMGDGDSENIMGDDPLDGLTNSGRSSTTATNAATQLQTIAEVKPVEELEPPFENVEEYPEKSAPAASVEEGEGEEGTEAAEPEPTPIPEPAPAPLQATFVRDTIPDGSEMAVGQEFTQTWILNNSGTTTWPAGISVTCVGGDDMLNNTVGTTATLPTPPGCRAAFSVNLKATSLASRHQISYWRLTSPDGTKFGDKLWCEIMVVEKNSKEDRMEQSILESKDEFEDVSEHANDGSQASSQMIFPKLPVESPVASTENLVSGVSLKVEDEPVSAPMSTTSTGLGEDDSEVEVDSLSDGVESFLTDDEYDVLDASDEEAFQECEKIG